MVMTHTGTTAHCGIVPLGAALDAASAQAGCDRGLAPDGIRVPRS
jgi:hypothetical protein